MKELLGFILPPINEKNEEMVSVSH